VWIFAVPRSAAKISRENQPLKSAAKISCENQRFSEVAKQKPVVANKSIELLLGTVN
jgi:hypothetical protein